MAKRASGIHEKGKKKKASRYQREKKRKATGHHIGTDADRANRAYFRRLEKHVRAMRYQ